MHVVSHHALIVIVFDSIHKGNVRVQNSSCIYENCNSFLNFIFVFEILKIMKCITKINELVKYLGPSKSIVVFDKCNFNLAG